MEHALVVIEGEHDPTPVVREAGQLTNGTDAELTLLYVTTEEEYARNLDAYLEAEGPHDHGSPVETATRTVRSLAEDWLEDVPAEYSVDARMGSVSEEVLAYAAENDVDHVFLIGSQRSPTGKALFGDDAQRIILNFDGATTIFTQ